MEFLTLKNRTVRIQLSPSRWPLRGPDSCLSKGQYNLGRQLLRVYASYTILEEFSIPESRLAIDFFVPNAKIAFEYQGIQHDEFNKHFHGDAAGFRRQQKRDSEKRRWCELNNIKLVEVRDPHITADKLKELICNDES